MKAIYEIQYIFTIKRVRTIIPKMIKLIVQCRPKT